MFKGVWDDGHLKSVVCRIANGERHSVYSDASFINCKIATPGHNRIEVILESEIGATVGVEHVYATCSFVNMALDNMSVKTAVHKHRSLNINLFTDTQKPEIGTQQGLLHGCDHVVAVLNLDNGETDAIVGNTLVNL